MKIKVTYETDEELDEVLQYLNPYIKAGAKVHKSDRYAPFKHAYLNIKNRSKCSNNAGKG